MNVYALILVCSKPCNLQMISETAYSSQTKLIGQSLYVQFPKMNPIPFLFYEAKLPFSEEHGTVHYCLGGVRKKNPIF